LRVRAEREIREYLETRDRYLLNAFRFIGEGEFRKASEFLWSAVALEIKLFALLKKNLALAKHEDLRNFVRTLAKEAGAPEVYEAFQLIERLHVNFYDEVLDPRDFELYLKKALWLINKLEEMLWKS